MNWYRVLDLEDHLDERPYVGGIFEFDRLDRRMTLGKTGGGNKVMTNIPNIRANILFVLAIICTVHYLSLSHFLIISNIL